ncbi:unnamed protein product [Vitrella brassicaformis CCMP3155]|uniref:Uncharacterized protein n=1 Tax=Vitrella brassicaformis (strain CCMP3155) TaxID=1169540 RepID=A0A0G4ELY7_VITBC|nr:unnamed protein product [Vitrella brassicaformis CCMP3155]|eukprot:CEL97987.1 unnamed protein product [Vitrella brassicaformis CCMP3155]
MDFINLVKRLNEIETRNRQLEFQISSEQSVAGTHDKTLEELKHKIDAAEKRQAALADGNRSLRVQLEERRNLNNSLENVALNAAQEIDVLEDSYERKNKHNDDKQAVLEQKMRRSDTVGQHMIHGRHEGDEEVGEEELEEGERESEIDAAKKAHKDDPEHIEKQLSMCLESIRHMETLLAQRQQEFDDAVRRDRENALKREQNEKQRREKQTQQQQKQKDKDAEAAGGDGGGEGEGKGKDDGLPDDLGELTAMYEKFMSAEAQQQRTKELAALQVQAEDGSRTLEEHKAYLTQTQEECDEMDTLLAQPLCFVCIQQQPQDENMTMDVQEGEGTGDGGVEQTT